MTPGTAALLPILALLYGSAYWGLVWYPLRALESDGMGGSWLALVAYVTAALLLLPFVPVPRGQLGRRPWSLGVLVLAAGWTNLAFVLAVLEGEVARVVVLFYLSPLWAALLGYFLLHERLTRRTLVMLALGLGGMALMEWQPAAIDRAAGISDLLALSSGFCFALTNVMTRRLDHLGVRVKTLATWLGVVLVSVAAVLVLQAPVPTAPAAAWAGTAAVGLGFFVSTLMVVYGVSNLPIQRSAVIMLFEVLVAALSAWWLAGEVIGVWEAVGGTMIVLAGLLAVFH